MSLRMRTVAGTRPGRLSAVKIQAVAQPSQRSAPAVKPALAVGVAATLLAAQPAHAEDAVDAAVVAATEAVQSAGSAARSAVSLIEAGLKALQEGYDVAAPVVKKGVDAVAPVVNEVVKATTDVAAPAIKSAAPVVTDTITGAIKSSGIDVNAVSSTASSVAKSAADSASAATPVVNKAVAFLASKDPVTLAEYGLAAVAAYYVVPPVLGALFGSLRGYAGELSATQVLDLVNTDGAVLIDIRSEKEKESSGLPEVAGSARDRVLEVEFAYTADRKLRGQLKDPNYIEAQVTALQIAALKKIGRGSKLVLLDRYGSTSRAVAKELAKRGFGKVFVVAGGMDGRGGWVASKLLVKPTVSSYSSSPSLARTISTRMTTVGGRKSLPAPSKA